MTPTIYLPKPLTNLSWTFGGSVSIRSTLIYGEDCTYRSYKFHFMLWKQITFIERMFRRSVSSVRENSRFVFVCVLYLVGLQRFESEHFSEGEIAVCGISSKVLVDDGKSRSYLQFTPPIANVLNLPFQVGHLLVMLRGLGYLYRSHIFIFFDWSLWKALIPESIKEIWDYTHIVYTVGSKIFVLNIIRSELSLSQCNSDGRLFK